mmetsp:Transcript_12495/g.30753  ORF Transcript_12495/g.30753 Transcript_12495/m.30753 type:complete len:317 (+) Transcript_12495:203-1153(+)
MDTLSALRGAQQSVHLRYLRGDKDANLGEFRFWAIPKQRALSILPFGVAQPKPRFGNLQVSNPNPYRVRAREDSHDVADGFTDDKCLRSELWSASTEIVHRRGIPLLYADSIGTVFGNVEEKVSVGLTVVVCALPLQRHEPSERRAIQRRSNNQRWALHVTTAVKSGRIPPMPCRLIAAREHSTTKRSPTQQIIDWESRGCVVVVVERRDRVRFFPPFVSAEQAAEPSRLWGFQRLSPRGIERKIKRPRKEPLRLPCWCCVDLAYLAEGKRSRSRNRRRPHGADVPTRAEEGERGGQDEGKGEPDGEHRRGRHLAQ